MLVGLRSAIYPAPDISAAKDWYSKLLGIEPYFDEPFYVGFEVGGFELGLFPEGKPGIDGPQPLWGVIDIREAFNRAIELGAAEIDKVADVGGGILVAAVRDPFGNRLGLIQNPNFDLAAVR